MQYATPQFIEQESKIISFLTFRQFFWLVGGGGVCIGLYYLLPFYFFAVTALIVAGLVVIIAFVKIDNVSLLRIFLNFLGFSFATKTYTWKRKEMAHPLTIEKKPEIDQMNPAKPMPTMTQASKLGSIKKLIDTKR